MSLLTLRLRSTATAAEEERPAPGFPRRGAHVPALDALRGLAILSVMAYHFNPRLDDAPRISRALARVFNLGGCGVDLFFVLSGFLITGILFDAKGSAHYFRNFYIRRSLRIFPLYYGALIAAFVALPWVSPFWAAQAADGAEYQGWLWLYLSNVVLAWKGTFVLGWFSHFWSLAVEEHFYLVWPLVIFLTSRKRAMAVCLACVLGALACRVALVLGGEHHAIAAYVLTPCRLDALAAGAWLALAVRGPTRFEVWKSWTAWSALGCVTAAALLALWKRDLAKMDGTVLALRFSLSSWLFATLLLHVLTATPGGWSARFWEGGFLRCLGKYSYALYVFHYPLTPVFHRLFPAEVLARRSGSPLIGQLAYFGLATAASLALALLSWNLFEKHFLRLKDVLTRRDRASAATAPVLDADAVPAY